MELFNNQQVDINLLPQMSAVELFKPQKSYLSLSVIKSIFFWLIMWGFFALGVSEAREEYYEWIPYARFIFYPFAMLSIIINIISYFKRGHALRAHDIIYTQGVVFTNTTTISFNRVQHCEISQGPLDQVFDLYTLKVFTAGGQSSDLEIPGLSKDVANNLKEYIVKATSKKMAIGEEE